VVEAATVAAEFPGATEDKGKKNLLFVGDKINRGRKTKK